VLIERPSYPENLSRNCVRPASCRLDGLPATPGGPVRPRRLPGADFQEPVGGLFGIAAVRAWAKWLREKTQAALIGFAGVSPSQPAASNLGASGERS
jgi:hypothetical protein